VTNCYFCHRPVGDENALISIHRSWEEKTDKHGILQFRRFYLVEEYAHTDCLEMAARTFSTATTTTEHCLGATQNAAQ
jgi:hypothetical protein